MYLAELSEEERIEALNLIGHILRIFNSQRALTKRLIEGHCRFQRFAYETIHFLVLCAQTQRKQTTDENDPKGEKRGNQEATKSPYKTQQNMENKPTNSDGKNLRLFIYSQNKRLILICVSR